MLVELAPDKIQGSRYFKTERGIKKKNCIPKSWNEV